MRDHINNIGALIANTIYNCAQGHKKKLTLDDFRIKYIKTSNEETLAESFKRYEKQNKDNFRVVKNG